MGERRSQSFSIEKIVSLMERHALPCQCVFGTAYDTEY